MRLFKVILFLGIVIGFICCAQDIEVGYKFLEKTHTVELGARDILFVLDTSCTMVEEHAKLLRGFGTFINSFLADFRLDWRVGILTMDIKNLGLLKFPNGAYFLDSNTQNYASYFQVAISNTLSHCPRRHGSSSSVGNAGQSPPENSHSSEDERGIYAVNNLLENDPHGFFRANTRLAVVFISDEDVRSGLYKINTAELRLELEEKDKPETLILNIRQKLGSKTVVSFHSIIVLPRDEDSNPRNCYGKALTYCLCQQLDEKYGSPDSNHQRLHSRLFLDNPFLFVGDKYYELAQPSRIDDESLLLHLGSIISGTVESICSSSYENFYQNLAKNLEEKVVNIPCKGQKIEGVLVQIHDNKEPLIEGLDYIIDRERGVVKFQPHVRSDRKITVDSKCLR